LHGVVVWFLLVSWCGFVGELVWFWLIRSFNGARLLLSTRSLP
jgi:hypothetical protein